MRQLGCHATVVDITPIVDGYFERRREVTPLRRGNFAARARMAVMYDHSVTWNGLVIGTSNKTETLLGYTTLFGDNAAALQPIGDLYKTQVRQLSADMGVPDAILRKPPTADLWAGQTDESEVGMRYSDIDRLLYWSVDRRRSHEQLLAMGFAANQIERVEKLVAGSEFKRQTPPVAKLDAAHAGRRLSLPASQAKAERAWLNRRTAARSTSSPRRSATWATSACVRWMCCAACRWSPPKTRAWRAGCGRAMASIRA